MAISFALGVNVSSNTNNQSSFATASWSPNANKLLIASYVTHKNGAFGGTPTIAGNGLSWELLSEQEFDTADPRRKLVVWVALTGVSPSTGATTVTNVPANNTNGALIVIDEVTGANISGTAVNSIQQFKVGPVDSAAATSLTITLDSAITSGNATYGSMSHESSAGTNTAGSGYTQLVSIGQSTPGRLFTEYLIAGSTTVDYSYSQSSIPGGLAIEVKAEASAVNFTPDPTIVNVSVVAPTKTLNYTPTPIVVNALVVMPVVATGSVPSPVQVAVSVVAPDKLLSIIKAPVVASVIVVAPTVANISFLPNEVWVETWDQQDN